MALCGALVIFTRGSHALNIEVSGVTATAAVIETDPSLSVVLDPPTVDGGVLGCRMYEWQLLGMICTSHDGQVAHI